MTGAFLLATRDGERRPVEIEHLTKTERRQKIHNYDDAMIWLDLTCDVLARTERQLKDEGKARG